MSKGSLAIRHKIRCGIDTGGTFTDFIGVDGASNDLIIGKFPSSAQDPIKSIVGVIRESGLDIGRAGAIVLGTTLGLNALLQRKGARVIFVTTAGFEDVLFIQRMNRRYHYSFEWVKPKPLTERCDCIGVQERIDARGRVITALVPEEMKRVADEIELRLDQSPVQDTAIAVCLFFSYLNPQHEIA